MTDAALLESFLRACRGGDELRVRELLEADRGLARAQHEGTTALHAGAAHAGVIRALLEHGADPNARDRGDNALALHFAAGGGHLESVRALLDAGSDVHGIGDLHEGEVIGWAACGPEPHRAVVALLLERGARHHIFSAIAMGDADLVRRVVEGDARALERRTSRFEGRQTPLHFALFPPDGLAPRHALPQYEMLDVLLELGADVEATDGSGRTPLELALLRGETETARRLLAAGASMPTAALAGSSSPGASAAITPELPGSVRKLAPMLSVHDMHASIAWYTALGFRLAGTNEGEGGIDWASLVFGATEVMLVPGGEPGEKPVALWFYTDRLEELYETLRARQLRAAAAALDGAPPRREGAAHERPRIRFVQPLHEAVYGMREFAVRDPDGYILNFAWPAD